MPGFRILFLSLACLAALGLPARAGEDNPSELLERYRALHVAPGPAKLSSVTAEFRLRSSPEPKVERQKEKVRFAYSWVHPEKEDFAMMEVPRPFHGPIRTLLRGAWREMTGYLFFPALEGAEGLSCTRSEGRVVIKGRKADLGELEAAFDGKTGRWLSLTVRKGGREAVYRYEAEKRKKVFRVSSRDVSVAGERTYRFAFEGHRSVSGYPLPCVVVVTDERNRATSFDVRYVTVNGKPAVLGPVDEDEVEEAVEAFRKGWPGWDTLAKVEAIKEVARLDHDAVSAVIARYGLGDRDPSVRAQAARSLGEMGRANAVPPLLRTMKTNEKHVDVYLASIRALGAIGDPRAIPELSKGWWNQRSHDATYGAARAKIDALGHIRCRASVDAILDLFYIAPDRALGPVADSIVGSLRRLTGQDFGRNRRAWKDWWKKNRAAHRFD